MRRAAVILSTGMVRAVLLTLVAAGWALATTPLQAVVLTITVGVILLALATVGWAIAAVSARRVTDPTIESGRFLVAVRDAFVGNDGVMRVSSRMESRVAISSSAGRSDSWRIEVDGQCSVFVTNRGAYGGEGGTVELAFGVETGRTRSNTSRRGPCIGPRDPAFPNDAGCADQAPAVIEDSPDDWGLALRTRAAESASSNARRRRVVGSSAPAAAVVERRPGYVRITFDDSGTAGSDRAAKVFEGRALRFKLASSAGWSATIIVDEDGCSCTLRVTGAVAESPGPPTSGRGVARS